MRRFTLSETEVRWLHRLTLAALGLCLGYSIAVQAWGYVIGNIVFLVIVSKPWRAHKPPS